MSTNFNHFFFIGEDNLLIDEITGNFIDYNQGILDLQLVEVEGMV